MPVGRDVHHAALPLVVVDNLDLFGPGVRPEETDPVLIIDSDAVLSGSIPKSVAIRATT